MKIKILSLVGGLALIFVMAVIWKMDSFIREDRSNWAQAQMRTQVLSLQQSIETQVKALTRSLAYIQNQNREKSFWQNMEPYKAFAWVPTDSSPKLENFNAHRKFEISEKELLSSLPDFKSLKFSRGKILIFPWRDANKNPWLLVVWPWSSERNLVLWAGPELLQGFIEEQKGSLSQLALVNGNGEVLAHSRREYFATKISDHPLWVQFREDGATQGGGSFQDSEGQGHLGYFSQTPSANILVMATSAHHELLAGKNKLWLSFLFIGLGLVLMAFAVLSLLKIDEPRSESQSFVPPPAPPAPVPVKAPEVSKADQQAMFKKIASSLGHELRGPLNRIYGFGQLLHSAKGDVKAYSESLLRETKSARDILEKLFSFAQEKDMASTDMSFSQVLKNVLVRIQPELTKNGVKLVQEIQDTASMNLAPKPLEMALENIFKNSIEAMVRRSKKEIHVKLVQKNEMLEATIEDTGEGIEASQLEKVMDPFFTSRNDARHLGLGLSAAYGILKQHGGDLSIESEKSKGTKVILTLPLEAKITKTHYPHSIPSGLPVDPMSFSPADVEIEQLLEFNAEDEAKEKVAPVNEDRTLALDMDSAQKLMMIDDTPKENEMVMMGQIDKANFEPNKKASPLDDYKVKVRRPQTAEKLD